MADAICPEVPVTFRVILHVVGAVSLVVNVTGCWLIVTHVNKKYKYRWCLLYLQLTALVTEVDMSIVNPPYFFFPMLGGVNCSPFHKYVPGGPHGLMTLLTFLLSMQLPAYATCFLYRHQAAAVVGSKDASCSKLTLVVLLSIAGILPLAISFGMFMCGISDELRRTIVLRDYPECVGWLSRSEFTVYDATNPWIPSTVGTLLAMFVYGIILGPVSSARTIKTLGAHKNVMSARTYKMHRTALMSLILQVMVPTTIVFVPIFFLHVIAIWNLRSLQGVGSYVTVCLATHSMIGTICMISTTPSFRSCIGGAFNAVKDNIMKSPSQSEASMVVLSAVRPRSVH